MIPPAAASRIIKKRLPPVYKQYAHKAGRIYIPL